MKFTLAHMLLLSSSSAKTLFDIDSLTEALTVKNSEWAEDRMRDYYDKFRDSKRSIRQAFAQMMDEGKEEEAPQKPEMNDDEFMECNE